MIGKIHRTRSLCWRSPPSASGSIKLGVIVVGSTPDELAAYLKSEIDRWGPVIKRRGFACAISLWR